ncbi:hypothetical protein DNHGIG_11270 [Collibacillus ludicampi]|uniref:Uncharacterized protein n=1 Tax=Collibacillus ludicampi TaxID=2771369 RepID=A0AAV4LCU1_9BACL|nr:hypothetical protein DNHGIG_11270 [Collibacillus ludicampi]
MDGDGGSTVGLTVEWTPQPASRNVIKIAENKPTGLFIRAKPSFYHHCKFILIIIRLDRKIEKIKKD